MLTAQQQTDRRTWHTTKATGNTCLESEKTSPFQ